MIYACPEHGELDKLSYRGYALGHLTPRKGPNELDLEGIEFTFDIESIPENPDEDLELKLVDSDGNENYLSKFSNWKEIITEAAQNDMEPICGRNNCSRTAYWVDSVDEVPDIS